MAKFIKSNFCGTEYVDYTNPVDGTRKFVCRFKYAKCGKASFLTFLTKNFTVEEYFERLKKGEAPLEIAQSKGFIQPHVKKALKEQGYTFTQEGFTQLIQDQYKNVRS